MFFLPNSPNFSPHQNFALYGYILYTLDILVIFCGLYCFDLWLTFLANDCTCVVCGALTVDFLSLTLSILVMCDIGFWGSVFFDTILIIDIEPTTIYITGLTIMASHRTFSGQINYLSGQIKFGQTNLPYVINGKFTEFTKENEYPDNFQSLS